MPEQKNQYDQTSTSTEREEDIVKQEDALKAKENVHQNLLLKTNESSGCSGNITADPFCEVQSQAASSTSPKFKTKSPVGSPKKKAPASKGISKSPRCTVCKRKVGLLGFTCKCEAIFCSLHRYPEEHTCSFDYKKDGKERLEKELANVVARKVAPI